MWMAGGGARPGTIYGETDDFSYNIVKDPGAQSATFTPRCCTCSASTTSGSAYRYQGLDQRLTGVEKATVVKELLA